MAGGTYTSQNKLRPGVYLRFQSTGGLGLKVGERGVVTLCEPLSWGPVAQVLEVEAGADTTPFTGYENTHPNNRFLTEMFKGSNRTDGPGKVLLYRPAASGSAQATATLGALTVTARYPGVRGNDLAVVITELTDPAGAFTVSTILEGAVVDSQQAATADTLVDNSWVTFSGTGALTADTGKPLTGGLDGTVAAAAYAAYLAAIEPYRFDIMVYDGSDATIQAAMASFVQRLAEEAGVYSQLVTAGMANPDSRFVINLQSGVTLSDGTQLTPQQATWWLGGAQAGARYNQSLTYATYPGAVAATPLRTNSQYVAALQAGQLVFFAEDGAVKVEQDINSLVTYTPEVGRPFAKNRVMRLCSAIAGDIYRQFSQNYIGVVNNNDDGRSQFKAAIVGYLLDIQGGQGIQNFTADDVQVLPGKEMDAILVNIALQPVDSVEKIYMTVEVN